VLGQFPISVVVLSGHCLCNEASGAVVQVFKLIWRFIICGSERTLFFPKEVVLLSRSKHEAVAKHEAVDEPAASALLLKQKKQTVTVAKAASSFVFIVCNMC